MLLLPLKGGVRVRLSVWQVDAISTSRVGRSSVYAVPQGSSKRVLIGAPARRLVRRQARVSGIEYVIVIIVGGQVDSDFEVDRGQDAQQHRK